MIWIPKIDVGIRKIATVFFVLIILHVVLTNYSQSAHLFFMGVETTLIIFLGALVFKFGLMRRIYMFFEHSEEYHIIDYYNILHPLSNYRILTSKDFALAHSKIFTNDSRMWAYFDIFRVILKKNKISSMPSILILGGGGGALVKEILDVWSDAEIDMVEISEKIIEISKRYFLNNTNLSNVAMYHADALQFVSSQHKKYDVIINDLYVNAYIPNQAFSYIFLKKIKKLCKKNTVLLLNISVSNHLDLSKIARVYTRVFPFFSIHKIHQMLIGYSGKSLLENL